MTVKKRTNGSESVESYAVCICPMNVCSCSCLCECNCSDNISNSATDGNPRRDNSDSSQYNRSYIFNMSSESRR